MDRHQIGRTAEEHAAVFLEEHGFRILWRNVRIGHFEVDLVAQKDDLAIIVEVRSRGRTAYEGPLASITWNKRTALLRAARGIWRGRLARRSEIRRVRIDVIAITAERVDWIRGAITAE